MCLLEADGDEQELLVTAEHPLRTQSGWTVVSELEPGDLVLGREGWAEVSSVEASGRTETVYNFEVEDFHTYFVGEGGVWAHNTCVGKFTKGMSSQSEEIARGTNIDKVDELVELFGGKAKNWKKKKKTWTADGSEVHYYEHSGIGKVGVSRRTRSVLGRSL